jgi:hypothetical protein
MCTIASILSIPMLLSSVLVDAVAWVPWLSVVDEVLLDWCHLLDSRRSFLVNRNLPFMAL